MGYETEALKAGDPELIRNRLSRIVRMQGSDPGFFVLAVHSYVEACLREHFKDDRKSTYLADLLYEYREDLKASAGGFLPAALESGILQDLANSFEGGSQ